MHEGLVKLHFPDINNSAAANPMMINNYSPDAEALSFMNVRISRKYLRLSLLTHVV